MSIRLNIARAVLMFSVCFSHSTHAETMAWANWSSATVDAINGSASANINTGIEVIHIGYSGEVAYSTSLDGGSNYWVPSSTYTSAEVSNAPTWGGRVDIIGGSSNVNRLVFSSAVVDPVLAIISLGQYGLPAEFIFDHSFTLLNQGSGLFGGSNTSLTQPAGNVLYGIEGNGIIQFKGSFTEISWTNPLYEPGYGFTVGVASVPEPKEWGMMLLGIPLKCYEGQTRIASQEARLGRESVTHSAV